MEIKSDISLAPYTTLKLGGQARYFCTLSETSDVSTIFDRARELEVKPFFLGGGSNTIFADGVIDSLVVKNDLKGVTFQRDGDIVLATVASGENWDEFVADVVERGFSGVEALSGIPGTVGAGPVQNIGAYGAELADVFVSLMAWDREQTKFREFSKEECEFSYRDSLFKRQPGQFFITEVKLQLKANESPQAPDYGSLQTYLAEKAIKNPDLAEIRAAVLTVRSTRLPWPKEEPNAGSFFTNPIVSTDQADELQQDFPDLVRYEMEDGQVKIPAGWLIERAGLKGRQFGHFHTSADNALVLIHDGGGATTELLEVQEKIKKTVLDKFGIELEREPNLII